MSQVPDAAGPRLDRAEAFARTLPFALYIGFLALAPVLAPRVADARWLYAVQIGGVVLALLFFARRYTELKTLPTVTARDLFLAAGTGFAVFIAWINLDLPWLSVGDAGGFDPSRPDGSHDPALVVLRIAGAALVIPVMEELFWRSFLLRWVDRSDFMGLDPRAISLRALVYCAIPFGLEHNLWFAGVLAGLAYGLLYRNTGRLWSPVLAHALTNLLLGLWVVRTGNWQFW
jgi:CAAX prenyl protease-like protein